MAALSRHCGRNSLSWLRHSENLGIFSFRRDYHVSNLSSEYLHKTCLKDSGIGFHNIPEDAPQAYSRHLERKIYCQVSSDSFVGVSLWTRKLNSYPLSEIQNSRSTYRVLPWALRPTSSGLICFPSPGEKRYEFLQYHFTSHRRWMSKKASLGVNMSDHSGIFFAGYVLPEGMEEKSFLTAWQQASEKIRFSKGFHYQELSRQEPRLEHQLDDGEGQHPFTFIEYTVFHSMADAQAAIQNQTWSAARAQLAQFEPLGDGGRGLYEVIMRVMRAEEQVEEMVVMNLYQVASPQTANFVATISWPKRVEFQSSQKGFLSATIHRSVSPESQYAVFNRAEWATLEEFLRCEARMEGEFPVAPAERGNEVQYFPGIFKVIQRFWE